MNLTGKTVLLLAPKFFGYEFEIKKELENFSAKVIYFDERPKNDFFTKVFIRLNFKSFIAKKIKLYYQNIIEVTKDENIDYLFLVAPETIEVETIKEIKSQHPTIKIYSYFWDSIKNKKTALDYLDISDRYFTFDSNDMKINKKIEFLPLFYIQDYVKVANTKELLIYDICFIGTVHSDRYKIIKQIDEQAKENNLKTYFYFYSPSKILFFLQKIIKKDFRNIKWKDVSFRSLDKSSVIDIINKSKSIIDIQHPNQTGLTMRTIEMVGTNKKLLTTNEMIKNYDFYNANNIFIFNRSVPLIDATFFSENFEPINETISESYSLKNWLKSIFNES